MLEARNMRMSVREPRYNSFERNQFDLVTKQRLDLYKSTELSQIKKLKDRQKGGQLEAATLINI